MSNSIYFLSKNFQATLVRRKAAQSLGLNPQTDKRNLNETGRMNTAKMLIKHRIEINLWKSSVFYSFSEIASKWN